MSDGSDAVDTIEELLEFLRRDLAAENLTESCEKRRKELIARLETVKVKPYVPSLISSFPETTYDDDFSSVYQPVDSDGDGDGDGDEEEEKEESAYLNPRNRNTLVDTSTYLNQIPNPNQNQNQNQNQKRSQNRPLSQTGSLYEAMREGNLGKEKDKEAELTYSNLSDERNGGKTEEMEENSLYMAVANERKAPSLSLSSRLGFRRSSFLSKPSNSAARGISHSGELFYCANPTLSSSSSGWKQLRSSAIINGTLQCLKNASSSKPVVSVALSECAIAIIHLPNSAYRHCFRVSLPPRAGEPESTVLLAANSIKNRDDWLKHARDAGAMVMPEEEVEEELEIEQVPQPDESAKATERKPVLKKLFGVLSSVARGKTRIPESSADSFVLDEAPGVRISGYLHVGVSNRTDYNLRNRHCTLYENGRFEVTESNQTTYWRESLSNGAFHLRVISGGGSTRERAALLVLKSVKGDVSLVLEAADKKAEKMWASYLELATGSGLIPSLTPASASGSAVSVAVRQPEAGAENGKGNENEGENGEETYAALDSQTVASKKSFFRKMANGLDLGKNLKSANRDQDASTSGPQLPPRPTEIATSITADPATAKNSDNQRPADGEGTASKSADGPNSVSGSAQKLETSDVSPVTTQIPKETQENGGPEKNKRLLHRGKSSFGGALTGYEIAKHRLDSVQAMLRERMAEIAAAKSEINRYRELEKTGNLKASDSTRRDELRRLAAVSQAEINKLRADENDLINEVKCAVYKFHKAS